MIQVKLNYVWVEDAPEERGGRADSLRIVILREDGAGPSTLEDGQVEYFPLE